jgi:hypothetical protein
VVREVGARQHIYNLASAFANLTRGGQDYRVAVQIALAARTAGLSPEDIIEAAQMSREYPDVKTMRWYELPLPRNDVRLVKDTT